MKKKIIHFKPDTFLPITENWIYNQMKGLDRFIPVVYTEKIENLDIFPLERIRLFQSYQPDNSSFLKFLKKFKHNFSILSFLYKDKPDIIHAHYGPAGYFFLPFKKFYNAPLITTFYGYDVNTLPLKDNRWKRKYEKLFKKGDIFLVEGNHMKNSLVKRGCPTKKIVVYHLGVDTSKIYFSERKIGWDNEIKILTACRFAEKKGLQDAIIAFSIVLRKLEKLNKKITFTILGDSDGSIDQEKEKKKLLKLINELNIIKNVFMIGPKSHQEFIDILFRHHIFFHPSIHAQNGDSEGGAPVSIIEASASGMPVVATYHCDIPEVILDKKTGLLSPEKNIELLAKNLFTMACQPEDWPKYGKAGRKHIENNYNSALQIKKLESIYFSLIDQL